MRRLGSLVLTTKSEVIKLVKAPERAQRSPFRMKKRNPFFAKNSLKRVSVETTRSSYPL